MPKFSSMKAYLVVFLHVTIAAIMAMNLAEVPKECLDAIMNNIDHDSLLSTSLVSKEFRSSILRTCLNSRRRMFMIEPTRSTFFPMILEEKVHANMAILGIDSDDSMSSVDKVKAIAMLFSSIKISTSLIRLINIFFGYLSSAEDKVIFRNELEQYSAMIDPYYWSSKVLRQFALDYEANYCISYHMPLLLLDAHPSKCDVIRRTLVRLLSYEGKLDGTQPRFSDDIDLYNTKGVMWALKKSSISYEDAEEALLPIADMIWHFCGRDKMTVLHKFCYDTLGLNPIKDYNEKAYQERMSKPENIYMTLITLDESNAAIDNELDRLEDPLIIKTLMPFYEFNQNIIDFKPQNFDGLSSIQIRALESFLRFTFEFEHQDDYYNYFWTIQDETLAESYVFVNINALRPGFSAKLSSIESSSAIFPEAFHLALWSSINTLLHRHVPAQKLVRRWIRKDLKSAVENQDCKVLHIYDQMMTECSGFKNVFELVTNYNLFTERIFAKSGLEFLAIYLPSANQA